MALACADAVTLFFWSKTSFLPQDSFQFVDLWTGKALQSHINYVKFFVMNLLFFGKRKKCKKLGVSSSERMLTAYTVRTGGTVGEKRQIWLKSLLKVVWLDTASDPQGITADWIAVQRGQEVFFPSVFKSKLCSASARGWASTIRIPRVHKCTTWGTGRCLLVHLATRWITMGRCRPACKGLRGHCDLGTSREVVEGEASFLIEPRGHVSS